MNDAQLSLIDRIVRFFGVVLLGVLVALSLVVVAHASRYVVLGADAMPPLAPSDAERFAAVESQTPIGHYRQLISGGWSAVALRLHAGGAALALLTAPIMMVTAFDERTRTVHAVAWLTFALATFVGAPTGLVLAAGAWGGPVAGAGFGCLAVAWMWAFAKDARCIGDEDQANHKEWVIRLFAILLGGVLLRVWVPLFVHAGLDFELAYPISAWWCWVPNLLLVEIYIRSHQLQLHGRRASSN